MPLSMVHAGETVTVSRVRGDQEFSRHLASLGFVEGASVQVDSQTPSGSIVCVKGCRLGVDKATARHIYTV